MTSLKMAKNIKTGSKMANLDLELEKNKGISPQNFSERFSFLNSIIL